MPSPFPGMDPFLEGYLWPDVHHRLATEIARVLTPRLRPRYVARIEVYVVGDEAPGSEIGILYPDVEVLRVKAARRGEGQGTSPPGGAPAMLAPPLTIPVLGPVEVRVPTVEVRDAAGNELVTTVEILSPVNKREPGLGRYRARRERLYQAGVHLLEIDLLRRGTRPLAGHPGLPATPYLITLTRARAPTIGLWPFGLEDPIPPVPIPLREPDPDIALDPGSALRTVYDESAYDLSVDYTTPPPPPPLSRGETAFVAGRVRSPGG